VIENVGAVELAARTFLDAVRERAVVSPADRPTA